MHKPILVMEGAPADKLADKPDLERIRAVAAENRNAALLPSHDARALLAWHVARALEGGRAAILRPERRRELVAAAVGQGLREFDANLVIAIVQDSARQGGGAVDHQAIVPALRLVAPHLTTASHAAKAGRDTRLLWIVLCTLALALVGFGGLVALFGLTK